MEVSKPGKTEEYLRRMQGDIFASLEKFGASGVSALMAATPQASGEAAAGWYYEIERRPGYFAIRWCNRHKIPGGPPLVILLQHGHGTRQGGYVQGRDFINPVMRPIFDQIDAEMRKVVSG